GLQPTLFSAVPVGRDRDPSQPELPARRDNAGSRPADAGLGRGERAGNVPSRTRHKEGAMKPIRDYDGLPPIKVVGVGGGGCNAVSRMAGEKIHGVQLVAVNTDAQALSFVQCDVQIRIGDKLTKGLGAGGDPARGMRAAEESRDEIKDAVRGAEMVFVTAGMGGGTGTGAAPIVAEVAR